MILYQSNIYNSRWYSKYKFYHPRIVQCQFLVFGILWKLPELNRIVVTPIWALIWGLREKYQWTIDIRQSPDLMKHCQRYARVSLSCVPLTGPLHTSDDDIGDGNDDDLDELIEVTSSSQTRSWLQTINPRPLSQISLHWHTRAMNKWWACFMFLQWWGKIKRNWVTTQLCSGQRKHGAVTWGRCVVCECWQVCQCQVITGDMVTLVTPSAQAPLSLSGDN